MRHLAALSLILLIAGCQPSTPRSALDPDRLLHMAGDEAGQITAPRERLARQLNVADRQTSAGHPADARKTLATARQTLETDAAAALSDQDRLAGWISLSELAREAEDKAFANAALDKAQATLDAVTPLHARCEYVLGVEREVRALRGDAPAARLLLTASEWSMEIPAQPTRRAAYFAFALECFRCDDYPSALAILRRDQDAAWRSDALTAISDRARWEAPQSSGSFGWQLKTYAAAISPATQIAGEAAPADQSLNQSDGTFGKALDFRSNYFRAK